MKIGLESTTRALKITALSLGVALTSIACATVDAATTTQSDVSKGNTEQMYYWYDGDKRRNVRITPELVADFGHKAVLQQAGSQKSAGSKTSPVFVDAVGGKTMRALPGGVIVRFKEPTNQIEADKTLKPFGTYTVRPIGGSGKSWLVAADPGLAALQLANLIYESGLVQSASPNWWKERARK